MSLGALHATRDCTHDGPCVIALGGYYVGQREDGSRYTVRQYAEAALTWAAGLDEFADITPTVRDLLGRPLTRQHGLSNTPGGMWVECTPVEVEAIAALFDEYADYVRMCDYAHDEDEEARLAAGAAGEAGPPDGAICWANARRP
jgi:hypothetical protein